MEENSKYIQMCIELASRALGSTYPNPMVGAIIVHNDHIIGSGYHNVAGGPHAEVIAIDSVKDKTLLSQSTLYVNLEPCSHTGKTPPCTDLIISSGIPRVVIGTLDPFAKVNGRGVAKLRKAGIEVTVGVMPEQCKDLNKRFFCYHTNKRPYVILKWAQSKDGFLDLSRDSIDTPPVKITCVKANRYTHSVRSHEQSILVGTRTALLDNPRLDTRLSKYSRNPLRVLVDRQNILPADYYLKDGTLPTLVFTEIEAVDRKNLFYIKIDFSKDIIPQMLKVLYKAEIQSLIVEGGAQLLQSFIKSEMWDEAMVFTAPILLGSGVEAPSLSQKCHSSQTLGVDRLQIFKR